MSIDNEQNLVFHSFLKLNLNIKLNVITLKNVQFSEPD